MRSDTLDQISRAATECMSVCDHVRAAAASKELRHDVADTLRDVGLTLATVDRTLFGFIDKILQEAGHPPLYHMASGSPGAPDLADAVARIRSLPEDIHKRVPSGGIISLLYHFNSVLDHTRRALVLLSQERRGRARSFASFLQLGVMPWLAGVVFGSSRFSGLTGFRKRAASAAVAVVAFFVVKYLRWITSAHRQLKVCHTQLQLLLRIWLICVDVFTAANASFQHRERSYATLVAESTENDYNDARKPAARLLLEHMSLPRDSAIWFKNNLRLSILKWGLDTLYAGMDVGHRVSQSAWWWWLEWPASGWGLAYYAARPNEASERAATLMQSTEVRDDVTFVRRVWALLDSPLSRFVSLLSLPRLVTFREVAIEGVSCHVLFDHALPGSYFSSRTLFTTKPRSRAESDASRARRSSRTRLYSTRSPSPAQATSTTPPTPPVETAVPAPARASSSPGHSSPAPSRAATPPSPARGYSVASSASALYDDEDDIIDLVLDTNLDDLRERLSGAKRGTRAAPACLLYIHGGGFCASSFASDVRFLTDWARKEPIMIVYVHYPLSPEARFPDALEHCLRVYCWLRLHCRKVALFGDSAGGNLATATVLRCVEEGLPVPDGLVLGYPALNLNSSPSPSRALHLADPLVPVSLLIGLANAYVPSELVNTPITDKLMCPALATDADVAQFPPTYIVAGGCDPLLDDAIDFNTRLRRAHVPGDMKVYRGLPHGFFSFQGLLREARTAVEYARRSIVDVLDFDADGGESASPVPLLGPGSSAGPFPGRRTGTFKTSVRKPQPSTDGDAGTGQGAATAMAAAATGAGAALPDAVHVAAGADSDRGSHGSTDDADAGAGKRVRGSGGESGARKSGSEASRASAVVVGAAR